MGKTISAGILGLAMVVAGASAAYALQAGGVEVGSLETGSVVGQPFKELTVDASFHAIEIGDTKTWYPPMTVIDFKTRPGSPVLLKVTNKATAEHGFELTSAANQSGPFVLNIKVVLKPGETQYIGVPTSDLFYGAWSVLDYRCHLHAGHVGGKLLMLK